MPWARRSGLTFNPLILHLRFLDTTEISLEDLLKHYKLFKRIHKQHVKKKKFLCSLCFFLEFENMKDSNKDDKQNKQMNFSQYNRDFAGLSGKPPRSTTSSNHTSLCHVLKKTKKSFLAVGGHLALVASSPALVIRKENMLE